MRLLQISELDAAVDSLNRVLQLLVGIRHLVGSEEALHLVARSSAAESAGRADKSEEGAGLRALRGAFPSV